MKLDGTGKKRTSKPNLKKMGADSYEENQKTDTIHKYRYYIKNNKTLYRIDMKNGKEKKLISCYHAIYDFFVCGSYILVRGAVRSNSKNTPGYEMAAFIIDTAGRGKKRLTKWVPAE